MVRSEAPDQVGSRLVNRERGAALVPDSWSIDVVMGPQLAAYTPRPSADTFPASGRAHKSPRTSSAIACKMARAASWQTPGMSLRIETVSIDASDPAKLARWWADVLGWGYNEDDDGDAWLEPPEGSPEAGSPALLFLKVPEAKAVKNRLHLDLRPEDQAAEVARVEALGAKRVDVGQTGDATWVVLADPEGNEFCILRAHTPEERAQLAG